MSETYEAGTENPTALEVTLLAILKDADPAVREAFMSAVAAVPGDAEKQHTGEASRVLVRLLVERPATANTS